VQAAETAPARPRERSEPENDPECLPSIEDLCPATPSRASGSGLHEPRGLATALPAPDAFAPPRALLGISRELGRRPRGPVASGDHASLGLGRRSPTSATVTTHGHTLRAANPRTRVELSPRCSPAPTDAGCVGLSGALPHRGPASRDSLTPVFTPTRSACADEVNRGPRRSSKGLVRALL